MLLTLHLHTEQVSLITGPVNTKIKLHTQTKHAIEIFTHKNGQMHKHERTNNCTEKKTKKSLVYVWNW